MKSKTLLILMAILLPLSTFVMHADKTKDQNEIPLYQTGSEGGINNRGIAKVDLACYYYETMKVIASTALSDLGNVTLTVTNCSTGGVWCSSFDSAMEPQTFLAISGEPGIYEIVYVTESGGVFKGTFANHQ